VRSPLLVANAAHQYLRKEFKVGIEREAEKRKAMQDGTINQYGAFPVNAVAFNRNGTCAHRRRTTLILI
jgi:hypothetical protein